MCNIIKIFSGILDIGSVEDLYMMKDKLQDWKEL